MLLILRASADALILRLPLRLLMPITLATFFAHCHAIAAPFPTLCYTVSALLMMRHAACHAMILRAAIFRCCHYAADYYFATDTLLLIDAPYHAALSAMRHAA